MHRIDGPGATVDDKFTEGDPVAGIQATEVTDSWLNDVQEELISILAARSIPPVKGTQNQVLTAIQQLIAAAIPPGEEPSTIKAFARATAPTGWLKANGSAVSRTTYSALFAAIVTDAGFTPQIFTNTIASPGVFSKSAHGFQGGERLRLSTTGALATGLSTSVDYFVERIDANTYYLQDAAGSRIITTGTQSGTHSYLQSWFGLGDGSTTFNVPDLRGEFLRGWDDARGIDTGRSLGTRQKGSLAIADIATASTVGPRVSTATTTAQGCAAYGFDDSATLSAYPQAQYTSATVVSGSGVFDSPGELATGVMRPRNVALLYCIKY